MPGDPPTYPIDEQESGQYTATITGNDGVTALPGGTLSTLTLTVYVVKQDGTEAIVNSRNQQSVLNANNGTVSAGGVFTWTIQPGDTTLIEPLLLQYERHYCLLEWSWPTGNQGKGEFILVVKNLRRVS